MDYLKAFLGFLLVFLVVDAFWINLVIKNLYAREVGHLLRPHPNLVGVMAFYVVYAAAITYLIRDSVVKQSVNSAFITGAVIGAIAYGTFTVTNYSVIQGWTMTLVITDILWGTFITGFSSFSGVLLTKVWPSR